MTGWNTLSPYARMGIIVGIIVLVLILIWGYMTDWKFRCWQRLPNTGQTWT